MFAHGVTFLTAFLGSAVESTEALTIVLAVGLTRGWRAPLLGAASALVALAVLVVLFGQVLVANVPEAVLKTVVGTLVLLFGMRWLRKAILRQAGVIALHDEAEEFVETVAAARRGGDRAGYGIALQGVFLEGLEVAFIVFAAGSSGHAMPIAAAGGIAAMLLVTLVGFAVRHPLTRVPENLLKFSVGLMLASLGTFWAAEGLGYRWPLDAASIVALVVVYAAVSAVAVRLARS